MSAVREAALRARDSLQRVREYIKAGVLEPTGEQTVELFKLVVDLRLADGDEETIAAVTRVDEFLRRVCPAVMGGVN